MKRIALNLTFLFLMSGNALASATTCSTIGRIKYCYILFKLDYPAKQSSIQVYVDGVFVPQSNWRYLASENAVHFEQNSYPGAGSTIKITYQTL